MKKLILTLPLLLLPFLAFAQLQDEVDIGVGATVNAALTAEVEQDVYFGDFDDIADLNNAEFSTDKENPDTGGTNAEFGIINLTGLGGINILVNFPTDPFALTAEAGTGTINYAPALYEDGATLTPISSGGTITLDGSSSTTEDIYVGGVLTTSDASSTAPGIYSGSFTVTFEYDI